MDAPDESSFRTRSRVATPSTPSTQVRLADGLTTDSVAEFTEPILSQMAERLELPGYRVRGEIARGGMGIVLAAFDLNLRREVAIKVMLEAGAASSAEARFTRESRIAAKLAHPAIPPIHALGRLEDGSPYLVMKRIRGETLADLLKGRDGVAAELPRFLGIFEQIAQAVGFAHSRGIIHRDLKPANVMVGEFGEVQVMDWGLAKCTNESSTDGEEALEIDLSASDSHATQVGSILGTPAFMAPEQARGEVVDSRADVFSMGAILCSILTGGPPLTGGLSAEETIRKMAEGEFESAHERLASCGADREIIALARRCLEVEASRRPADAREVAEKIAEYRNHVESRLRSAERERAAAEAKMEEQRKRKRTLVFAGASIGLALTVGAGIATWQAFRASEAESATRIQLSKTDAAKTDAELARDQAKGRYLLALSAFDDMVFAIQAKLSHSSGTLELRKELLSIARDGLKKLLAEAERHGDPDEKLAWSYFQMGNIEEILGNFQGAVEEYRTGLDLAKRLAEDEPMNAQRRRDVSVGHLHLGDLELRKKELPKALASFQAMLAINEELAKDNPENSLYQRDLCLAFGRLGSLALELGNVQEAHDYHKRRLAIAENLAALDPADEVAQRDLASSYETLGASAGYLKQPEVSLECFRKMSEIMKRSLDRSPDNVIRQRDLSIAYTKLGSLLGTLGQLEPAMDYLKRSVELMERMVGADRLNVKFQTDLLVAYDTLGAMEDSRLGYDQAIEWYRKERAIVAPLHEKGMLVGQFQNALANVDSQIAESERLGKALVDLDFLFEQPAHEWSMLLEHRARSQYTSGDAAGLATTAEACERIAEGDSRQLFRAARALGYALEFTKRDAATSDQLAARALNLLAKIPLGEGQVAADGKALAAMLKADPRLAALLEREDVKRFLESLEGAN